MINRKAVVKKLKEKGYAKLAFEIIRKTAKKTWEFDLTSGNKRKTLNKITEIIKEHSLKKEKLYVGVDSKSIIPVDNIKISLDEHAFSGPSTSLGIKQLAQLIRSVKEIPEEKPSYLQ